MAWAGGDSPERNGHRDVSDTKYDMIQRRIYRYHRYTYDIIDIIIDIIDISHIFWENYGSHFPANVFQIASCHGSEVLEKKYLTLLEQVNTGENHCREHVVV